MNLILFIRNPQLQVLVFCEPYVLVSIKETSKDGAIDVTNSYKETTKYSTGVMLTLN